MLGSFNIDACYSLILLIERKLIELLKLSKLQFQSLFCFSRKLSSPKYSTLLKVIIYRLLAIDQALVNIQQ